MNVIRFASKSDTCQSSTNTYETEKSPLNGVCYVSLPFIAAQTAMLDDITNQSWLSYF